jgi:uncharacterized protein (DUF3084 family)
MVAPFKKIARAQLKKIYVLNDTGDMAGEYVLDPDCPIDYNDFLKLLPEEGVGDRGVLFVGEYVFTAFQSGKFVFVLLSRGQLAQEDIDWTTTLLTAADAHLAAEAKGANASPPQETSTLAADAEKRIAEREMRLEGREKELAKLEARLQADDANLKGRMEELERQKAQFTSLADYVAQTQQGMDAGLSRARQSLEMAEQLATSAAGNRDLADGKALADLRQQFEDERKALLVAKEDLEGKYREASDRIRQLEQQASEALDALKRERTQTAEREAEAERLRAAIEARVQELSQRFAAMAKERLVNSHRPSEAAPATAGGSHEVDSAKEELATERKFLQRRAIDLLDREEKVRGREMAVADQETTLAKREQELAERGAAFERTKGIVQPAPASVDAEEARKDIERRVKIIQQKALDLLDREEKLRKRAAELEALEARLAGKVPT